MRLSLLCTGILGPVFLAGAFGAEPLGSGMESYSYPHPVAYRSFQFEGHDVRMAYMDVKPSGEGNGKTVLLLHGKNFFGAYWKETIERLAGAGYRVIVPDQIGFGKSSKPEAAYSFHEMGRHTKELLDSLGVKQTAVVGHSMGGMVAVRFALMYPELAPQLVLENPIGLEDYKTAIPYVPTDKLYASELAKTEPSIRRSQQAYFVQWKPAYEDYVQVHYRWTLGPEAPRMAKVSALTTQMIYQQPIVYELPLIRAKTLLVIGQEDRTAVGKDRAAPSMKPLLGNYPKLGRAAAKAIPSGLLMELPGVGHIPHFEAPDRFHKELLEFLAK